jgi:hypothetical protein
MKMLPLILMATCSLASIALAEGSPAPVAVDLDTMTILFPSGGAGKLPVIFLAHNGGEKRENWGDFPAELASKGYAVVNMGWTVMGGAEDLRQSMAKALAKYGDRIDQDRAAFIGGCHGCVKFNALLMGGALPVKVKALVFLSISEYGRLTAGHAPLLGIYSTRDHLGANYIMAQKDIYASDMSEPKKVIALDATAHGDELVVDPATKAQVRSEAIAWIASLI